MSIRNKLKLLLFPFVLFLITACSQEELKSDPTLTEKEEEAKVTLSVKLPGANNPATKGADVSHEDKVETIDVFVFKNGELTDFDYGRDITDISEGSSVNYSLSVTLKVESNCDLMVLINTRDIVEANFPVERLLNRENPILKEDFTQQLTKSFSPATGWNTQQAIPMWGMKKNININGNTSLTGANSISASRMLARVNIAIDNSISTTTDFALKSVRVYNYNTVGAIIPDEENWNEGNTSPYVTQPTLPQNQGWIEGEEEPILYTDMTLENRAILNSIYLFEANKGVHFLDTSEDFTKNPCIVIGGYYRGNTNEETFYKVDFALTEGTNVTYLDILRNHSYNITIQNINGPGKSSPQQALEERASNITAGIVKWNDYDMDEVWFDGQYYYAVTPLFLERWITASPNNQVKIKTDYPTWSYELSDRPTPNDPAANPENLNWLVLSSSSPQPGVEYPSTPSGDFITFDILENELANTRIAYMHFKAGGFTQTTTITQTAWYISNIEVTPSGEIPTIGEYRTFTIEGNFPDTPIRAIDLSDGDRVLVEGVVEAADGNNSGTIYIPTAWVNGYREVALEYYDFAQQQWRMLQKELQEGWYFFIHSSHQEGNTIKGSGDTFSLDITGSKWPHLFIRGVEQNTDSIASSQTSLIAGSESAPVPSANITVNANRSWSNRTVLLQWSINMTDWTSFFSENQAGYNGDITITHTNNTPITNTGQNIPVTATGYRPQLKVEAISGSITPLPGELTVVASEDANNSTNTQITVSRNPNWESREIQFRWYKNNEWIYLSKGTQPGYDGEATVDHTNNTAIPGTGRSYTITAKGYRPAIPVHAINKTTKVEIATQNTTYSEVSNNEDKSRSITIPPFGEWNTSRTIQFEWKRNNTWIFLSEGVQSGYNITPTSNMGTTIDPEQKSYTISFTTTSHYPTLYFRAWDTTNKRQVSTTIPSVSANTTNQSNIPITIQRNSTNSSRTIQLQWDTTNQFTNPRSIGSAGTQAKANYLLSTNRVVAKTDALSNGLSGNTTMDWATAMGIPTQYNTQNYPYLNGSVYNPVTLTGCGGYWEGSINDAKTGQQKWRLPTTVELTEMYNNRGTIGGLNKYNYWTVEQNGYYTTNNVYVYSASIVTFNSSTQSQNGNSYLSKREGASVTGARCVRDL